MITKEDIKREVDTLPENLLDEVYAYLTQVSQNKKGTQTEEERRKSWEAWWNNPEKVSDDFMNERIQPPLQARENRFDLCAIFLIPTFAFMR